MKRPSRVRPVLVRNRTGACAECMARGVPNYNPPTSIAAWAFGTRPYLRIAYCEHNDASGFRARCHRRWKNPRLEKRGTRWWWVRGDTRSTGA